MITAAMVGQARQVVRWDIGFDPLVDAYPAGS
jgi:hypothetical protein